MNTKITKNAILVLILFLQLFANTSSFGSDEKKDNTLNQIKKTIVFLGTVNEEKEPSFSATGFLVNVQGISHLITAKHVVVKIKNNVLTNELSNQNLCVFFNTKSKNVEYRSIKEIKSKYPVDWVFHKDKNVDIAIIPFGLNTKKDDVKTIPDDLFLSMDRLFELYDVFFLSYQPGVADKKKINPIIRTGIISLINDDKTFYIDGFSFPGNSGSPLFLKPTFKRFDENNIIFGKDPLAWKFVGIIGEYIPYQDIAISLQTKRPRVIFEENTVLYKVRYTTYIKEIIASKKFKKQIDKLIK